MKTKIKPIIILTVLVVSSLSFGQVRIADNPANSAASNSSAFLDASSHPIRNTSSSHGKGLLFPRTDLTVFSFEGTPMGVPNSYPTYFDGFIVYNTATSGTATVGATLGGALFEGFWYYENKTTDIATGTWKPIGTGAFSLNRQSVEYIAADGDINFDTPQTILDVNNIDVYRNGARIDFTQVDLDTIELDLGPLTGCYAGDEIRIVQLQ